MIHDPVALYHALAARDSRFDGVFFVGVTSTRIYCRPVCPARTPRAANCRFFSSAEAAEHARFRPCLRCRPELAPGNAPVDDARRIAHLLVQRIDEGMLDDGAGLERVATQFGWSSRQIRRIVQQELGVSPIELILTRRLLLAKQLLTETMLPVTEIAYASGFASLRRFNDAFARRYGMPPTRLRKTATREPADGPGTSSGSYTLQLAYRRPFDWAGLLRFLGARALAGVELVDDGAYVRTVQLGEHRGWVRVRDNPDRATLLVDLTASLTPALPALLGRLRHLFDLSARPDVIDAHLALDPMLAEHVRANPGMRVPGAFDGFELALRAILGQQISVAAATTLAGRVAEAFGEPITSPYARLGRLAPTPARIAAATIAELCALGIIPARARCLIALAGAVARGELRLEPGAHPDAAMAALVALPGIGAWTAHYIAMRALRWPDAFPSEDLIVRRALGGLTPADAAARSDAWRPWRSYATMHLWRSAAPRAARR